MKKLIVLTSLIFLTACVPIVNNVRPPRFQNQQEVQIIETKYRVKVVGTSCDVPIEQQEFASCRYLVKFPLRGNRTMMFEEAELEEIK
jgi:hypothetical protein